MNIKKLFPISLVALFFLSQSRDNPSTKKTTQEIIQHWQEQNITFDIPETVYIEKDVEIGCGSRIGAGVYLTGKTKLGNNVSIGPYSVIEDSIIDDEAQIKSHTVVSESSIEKKVKVGPFAHIQKNSHLQEETKIGNFVEVSQSKIGKKTKAYHFTLLEHAEVGDKVNIGGGTITSDYDGKNKFKTIIQDKVFVGSNNTLVAPVVLKEGCFTAAGSVITKDVPARALGIGRARQVNKENYAEKLMYHPKQYKKVSSYLGEQAP